MYLKHLDLHGFKTFANRTDFEFDLGVTAIVGPNGSGKCVTGETRVTLADGRDVPIQQLVKAALRDARVIETDDDGELTRENPHAIQVLSINPVSLRIEAQPVAAFVKRRAPEILLQIQTRSGRQVTATAYHPLFTFENGMLRALRADELQVGVRIAVPRNLPTTRARVQFSFFEMLHQFEFADAIYVPNSPQLREWAENTRAKFGTWVAWITAARVPYSQFKGLLEGQAVNVATLVKLARAANSTPPLTGELKSHGSSQMRMPAMLTPDLARFLGLLIAEGRNTSANQIWFVNSDSAINDEFERLAQSLFGLGVSREHYKPVAEDCLIYSRTLGVVLEKIFQFPVDSKSAEKQIPSQVFQADAETQWAFLSGLFEGDAYLCAQKRTKSKRTTSYIEYVTASPLLAQQVVALLLRLGIFALIRPKQNFAANTLHKQRRTYYAVFIYGTEQLRNVAQCLSFVGVKSNALRTLRALPSADNPNLDVIPGITPLVKDAARAAGVKIKPNRRDYPKLAAYVGNVCQPSRGGLLETVAAIEQLGATPHDARTHLERIATVARSDIYWDEIVSIERVAPCDEWVYDLCVAGTHNFVAGNIIVHNSNVADAVRWVMGEQSMSELRVKKTEDLIFTGSTSRARLGMAEVSLTFENPDPWKEETVAPSDDKPSRLDAITELLRSNPSEVTIGRRAFRDGQNEYFLNGTRVRLRDILELLARWGLARNTYAVIGQGLVDQALSLRPEERRALFEEAAGIGLYQSKRNNALDKLSETQQNLVRVNDIVNEIAPRLPTLARQAERARNYDGVVQSLDERLRTWYAFQWSRVQGVIEQAATREKNAREILHARRAEVQANTARLAQLRRRSQELRAQLAEGRRQRAALENGHATRQRELAVLEERLRLLTQQRDEAASEIAELQQARQAQVSQIELATRAYQTKERERAALAEHLRAGEKELRELEHRAAHAETLLEENEPQIRALARQLATLRDNLGVFEEGLRTAASLSSQADMLTSYEIKRAQAVSAVEAARTRLAEIRATLAIAERDVAGARASENSARESLRRLDADMASKSQRADARTREVNSLATQRDQAHARVEESARQLAEIDARVAPADTGLAETEKAQAELEEQESRLRARLAEFEEQHNRAVLDVERARAEVTRIETEIEDDLASGRIVAEIKLGDENGDAPREAMLAINTDLPHQLALKLGDETVTLPVVTEIAEGLDKDIRRLRNQVKYMGTVNPNAPQEYAEVKARHAFLTEQASDATHAIESLNKAIAELDEIMRRKFEETFKAVNVEFTKFFTLLFNGGAARLELTDPENIATTGIDVIAKPPGKRAAHLAMLSGGERALTAAALLFAILKVSPTPFCVLDEVDAALDEANVGRFRDALRTLASETQFIVVTHNRTTMESADAVYGITMSDDGVSQAISLRLDTEKAEAGK